MTLELYFLLLSFVFGAVIGSFLNVVIYRLHTGRSINGHSHCLSCQKPLRWFELLPVLSYLVVWGRCRGCSSYIPFRYLLVEAITGISFFYLYLTTSSLVELVLLGSIVAVLIVGVVYDLYHMIIPNEIPLILTVLSVTLLTSELYGTTTLTGVVLPLASAVVASGFYALLWTISKGRWLGLGDAKLAFPLGLLLSLGGVFSMVVLSFWIGALFAVGLLLLQFLRQCIRSKRYTTANVVNYPQYFTMKSEIPFAPFLVVAFLLVYFGGADVLLVTEYVIAWFF